MSCGQAAHWHSRPISPMARSSRTAPTKSGLRSTPRIPYQKGRTDRSGWLSFVPDVPGTWRVKVIEESGHGLDLEIDTSTLAPAETKSSSSDGAGGSVRGAAFVLRPIAGVAIIAALFGALIALYRRTQSPP